MSYVLLETTTIQSNLCTSISLHCVGRILGIAALQCIFIDTMTSAGGHWGDRVMKTGPVVVQWALALSLCLPGARYPSLCLQVFRGYTSVLALFSELNCIPSGGVKSMKAGRRVRESQLVVLLEEYVDTSC